MKNTIIHAKENITIECKTGSDIIDWESIANLYGEIGLVAGFGKKRDLKKIKEAFLKSFKVVTAWEKDKLVGAGRLLSDGICYGMIFDVGVLPSFQKMGVGKKIMNELMKGNENICIHLTSTFENEAFYNKLGFNKHKTAYAKYPYKSEYLED